ncbi:MAG: sensor histidine kinase [Stenotrophobium sp.]
MRGGLYRRLFLWFFVANMLTLLFSVVITERIASRVYANHHMDWQALSEEAVSIYSGGGADALRLWIGPWHRHGMDFVLMNNGRNVLDTPLPQPIQDHLNELAAQPSVVLRLSGNLTLASVQSTGPHGENWLFMAARDPPGPPPERLLVPLAVQLLMSLLMIGLVDWWVSRSISKPVAAVQAAARRMATGDLSARVGQPVVAGTDELALLARDFDHMAGRIEGLVEHLRILLQDVSHELRSPLARMQLALELARDKTATGNLQHLDHAEREILRLDHIIGDMLALTRLEAKLPERMDEIVDLGQLAAERIDDLRSHTDNVKVELHQNDGAVEIQGQHALLARALDNLLSNAVKYGGTPGEIRVCISRAGEEALIEVADRGRGVPASELPQLFRIYYRGSNARDVDGQGLGLAIVERIVRAHGGRCLAGNRDEGGLRIALYLPLKPDQARAPLT